MSRLRLLFFWRCQISSFSGLIIFFMIIICDLVINFVPTIIAFRDLFVKRKLYKWLIYLYGLEHYLWN